MPEGCDGSSLISGCFYPLHSGVTAIFDHPLFVSTLIFVSLKDLVCQLSVSMTLVFDARLSEFSSRRFFFLLLFLYYSLPSKTSGFSRNPPVIPPVDEVMVFL